MDDMYRMILSCTTMAMGAGYFLHRKNRQARRFKVREININRKVKGFYTCSFLPMKEKDPEEFFKYTRMSVPIFNKLLSMIEPFLRKKNLPDSVSSEERLAVTLHYLSQGMVMKQLAWSYQLGHITVHKIIHEVCEVLWTVLNPLYLKSPDTPAEWQTIAKGFSEKWNFPNCIGALDGKHINIQAPSHSGSLFFNYKKTFSIVLLAACDADYNFTLVDIGAYGSQSDGGIFKESAFGTALDMGSLNVPQPSPITNNLLLPYVLVADEAFPLKSYIMRPFPGRHLDNTKKIFNYRLSRARRCIENTFGILVARWRLLRQVICADIKNIDNFVKAIVCLHNYIKKENNDLYCPTHYADTDTRYGDWRTETEELASVGRLSCNYALREVYRIREALANYFVSKDGELPWQYSRVEMGREPIL